MANPEQLEEQREETRLIIEELLEKVSAPTVVLNVKFLRQRHQLFNLEKPVP